MRNVYEDLMDMAILKAEMERALGDYNRMPGVVPMRLVLFRDAIEHSEWQLPGPCLDPHFPIARITPELGASGGGGVHPAGGLELIPGPRWCISACPLP